MKIELTELNSGYKGKRTDSILNEKNKPKIIIVLTLIIAFVFVFLLSTFGIVPIDALILRVKVGVTGTDQRFPVSVNTESTIDIETIGGNLAILTTENVMVYSDNGRLIFSEPHVYTVPAISVNGNKAVVFDRGGKGYMLITDKKLQYKGEADNHILTAEYGSRGNYALGTKGTDATSTFTVYNNRHNEIFKWNCAYEYIVNIALSENGNYAGVAVLGAKDGKTTTTVQYFGFDYKEPLNTQTISGATPLDLEFTGFNRLVFLADNGAYVIERKKESFETLKEYYSSEFNSCQISNDGDFIVSLAKYGSKNDFEINVFKPNGKIKTTINVKSDVKRTCMSERYIFALSENEITVYNFSGREVSKINFKGEINDIYSTDDFIFIASLDKISRCFSFGDAEIEL